VYRFVWRFFLLTILILTASCNMTGYHDLAQPVNRFGQFGIDASSFIRTTKTEHETGVECFTVSDIQASYGSCAWLSVVSDSQVIRAELRTGTYERNEQRIEISFEMQYNNQYSENATPSRNPGAVQYPISKSSPDCFAWDYDSLTNILEFGGHAYLCMDSVYDRVLSQSASDWPDRFIKLYILSTMSAHCRIEGFGGIGMLQYNGKHTLFQGLLDGTLEFCVDGLKQVTTRFIYTDHSDISGFVLNGEMRNISDMSGSGYMEGVVRFHVKSSAGRWQGTVDYSNMTITHTLASSGYYILSIDDGDYLVDYDYGNPDNFDFSELLDPDPACW